MLFTLVYILKFYIPIICRCIDCMPISYIPIKFVGIITSSVVVIFSAILFAVQIVIIYRVQITASDAVIL